MSVFEIVFSGELMPGASADTVQSNLARLFQADESRVAMLFSGRRLVLKNNLDAAAAEKFRATLERAGALAHVVAVVAEVAPPVPATPARRVQVAPRDAYMAAFASVDAPDFGMADAGSVLQDDKPQPAAPELDLEQFSVAPAGADMGQVKSAPPPAAPDTSHLKILP